MTTVERLVLRLLMPVTSRRASVAAQLLWPLPARAHDWMVRHLGGRPARIAERYEFDAKGRRKVTKATYLWEPTVLLRPR